MDDWTDFIWELVDFLGWWANWRLWLILLAVAVIITLIIWAVSG